MQWLEDILNHFSCKKKARSLEEVEGGRFEEVKNTLIPWQAPSVQGGGCLEEIVINGGFIVQNEFALLTKNSEKQVGLGKLV